MREAGLSRAAKWAALAIVLILGLAAPATASAARALYVSSTAGTVSAFSINADGSLTSRGVPGTGGTLTEGLAITPDAKYLYVANFTTNSVSAFQILAGGSLASLSSSPFTTGFSTPLGVAPDPDGGHLFAWNHGNAIAVSTINSDGSLSNISGSAFTVPSGFTNPFAGSVAPNGDHLYVPFENTNPGGGAPDRSGVFSVAANGAVSNIQTVVTGGSMAADGNPFGSGITPNGKFVYISAPEDLAGVGRVYGFAVDSGGALTAVPGSPFGVAPGSHPLNIAISPDGDHLYVATRQSSTVNGYTINADGSLTALSGSPFATGGTNGKALAFTPSGKRLYVANNGSNNVSGFNVASTGALTLIPGSPFGLGDIPASPDLESIAITPDQPPTSAFNVFSKPKRRAAKFDGSASSDFDGKVARYDWHFGDGRSKEVDSPTTFHGYKHPGLYTVTLRVIDNEGCSKNRIFTGKAMLCNGGPVARTTHDVVARKLSISYDGSRFEGKLRAARSCKRDKIHVYRKRKGRDRLIGSDHTSHAGKWRVKETGAHGKFYAQAIPKHLADGTQCLATRSRTIKIG